MRDFILWLIFLAIDVFKALVIFVVIFGIAAFSGFLYAKDFINLLIGNDKMWNFLGSVAIAVFGILLVAAIALFMLAWPAFQALREFHFG